MVDAPELVSFGPVFTNDRFNGSPARQTTLALTVLVGALSVTVVFLALRPFFAGEAHHPQRSTDDERQVTRAAPPAPASAPSDSEPTASEADSWHITTTKDAMIDFDHQGACIAVAMNCEACDEIEPPYCR